MYTRASFSCTIVWEAQAGNPKNTATLKVEGKSDLLTNTFLNFIGSSVFLFGFEDRVLYMYFLSVFC